MTTSDSKKLSQSRWAGSPSEEVAFESKPVKQEGTSHANI